MRFLPTSRSIVRIMALLLPTIGCRPNLSVPSTNNVETLREYARRMSQGAVAGDRVGVAEYREAAAEAYSRACGLGDEDSCRETVRYWASVADRNARSVPVIDARTGAEVEDPRLASLALRGPEEMRRAWYALARLSVQRAAEQSYATHDVTPLLRIHHEFSGSNVEEPAFYAVAMSETRPEPSRRYLEIYVPNGVTDSNEHGASVRRHLAEIELRDVVRSLRESPERWELLRQFSVRYPELYIEEPAAFELARVTAELEFILWYRRRYANVQGVGARLATVRERHAAVQLPRLVDAVCAQQAHLRAVSFSANFSPDIVEDFRGTAAWLAAGTRLLACANELPDSFRGPLLGQLAAIFEGTPAGREASAAHDTFEADAVIRSLDLDRMRAYLGGGRMSAANWTRVSVIYIATLRRSRVLSSGDLRNYRDVFPVSGPEYRQIEELREAEEQREAAAQAREERRQREQEAREERRRRAEEAREEREERRQERNDSGGYAPGLSLEASCCARCGGTVRGTNCDNIRIRCYQWCTSSGGQMLGP